MDAFVKKHVAAGKRVVLVTSGGTTVPLELNTVRFIDNFSSGTRGALCTEAFLRHDYAVVFLHRKGSNFPFLTHVVKNLNDDPLRCLEQLAKPSVDVDPQLLARLLPVSFSTIFEYLFLLREACQSLNRVGSLGMIFLAAAVSDFYVPEHEMATNKIQSRAHDGLTVQLRNVPKVMGSIKDWSPEAFLISFKLETNLNILEAKAAGALQKYKVDAVVSNQLQTIRDLLTIVWKDPQATAIEIAAEHIGGDEEQLVQVSGLCTKRVDRGSAPIIEPLLVEAIFDMHGLHLEEPSRKHARTC